MITPFQNPLPWIKAWIKSRQEPNDWVEEFHSELRKNTNAEFKEKEIKHQYEEAEALADKYIGDKIK
ncbi:hypothetical protein PP427_gp050 [Salmonella phage KM16]|uniref:hypothetical protein n=1 Tax=Salmonella phage KM16 TaxID=2797303 RepID=UPI0024938171|nr:hypothetical protein PP427_gp050 [Salmonella phage KM16]